MPGLVFTGFVEMVEDRFSPAIEERTIEAPDLPHGEMPILLDYHPGSIAGRPATLFRVEKQS